MISRPKPRKVRDMPTWCAVDLNQWRDQRVALLTVKLDAFEEQIADFEREHIEEPLGLTFVDEVGWNASLDTDGDGDDAAGLTISDSDKRECITKLLDAYESAEIQTPVDPKQLGVRLGMVDAYRTQLANKRRKVQAIAARPDRQPLHFRKPAASRLQRAVEWAATRNQRARSGQLEAAGAILGVTWAHELYDVATPFPRDTTDDNVHDFSEAVQEELEEWGLDHDEMIALLDAVTDELINPHQRDAEEARKLVDFGSPAAPKAVTTSS